MLLIPKCAVLQSRLKQREYISPEIVNEIITIMGQSVLRTILAETNASFWFSIITDEAAIYQMKNKCLYLFAG